MVKFTSLIPAIALFMSTLSQGRVMPDTESLHKRDPSPDGALGVEARAAPPFEVVYFQAPLCAGANADLAAETDVQPGTCVDSVFPDPVTGNNFAAPFESYILAGGKDGQNCPLQTWSQPDCKGTLVTGSALKGQCEATVKLAPLNLVAQSFRVCCQGTAGC
ncbi:hypothetical protein BU16DRAFT_532785 [Lophium mytilinum]|uniref:Uncharacterized protein n=1 Tax=Lophium mytilinum TaxID=390894 RepID=A0A6A6RFB2_9PEZI|nr:hypothetical protein BU16DRAFT_532785 [Lophium mytilinum]